MSLYSPFAYLLFLLTLGAPVSLPPADPDPLLDKLAPPQAVYFTCSSGAAAANGDSPNHTEQLLAEPEVVAFAKHMEEQFRNLAKTERRQRNDVLQTVVEAQPTLIKLLLTQPTMAYLSELTPSRPWRVRPRGAIVVRLGPMKDELAGHLEKLKGKTRPVTIAGKAFQTIDLEDDLEGVPLTMGVYDDLLIIALGTGEVESILKRREGEAPKWLAELRKRLPIERQATVSLLDFASVRTYVEQLAPNGDAEPLMRLGLRNAGQLISSTGLEGKGFVRRTALDFNGAPQGLFTAFAGSPLTADDLKVIPADATAGAAVRFNLRTAVDEVVKSIEPFGAEPVEDGFEAVERIIGMKVREGFLASLGDVWSLHTSPADGGLLAGWTMTVQVKDRGKVQLGLALERVRQVALAQGRGSRRTKVEWTKFAGQDIYTMVFPNNPLFGLSYCVTDTHLVMALYPQAIKSYLSSQSGSRRKLGTHPAVSAELKKGDAAPVFVVKSDNRRLVEMLYPLAIMGLNLIQREISYRHEGVDFEPGHLPSVECLLRHAADGTTFVRRTSSGFEMEQRQQLPASASPPLTLLVLALTGAVF